LYDIFLNDLLICGDLISNRLKGQHIRYNNKDYIGHTI